MDNYLSSADRVNSIELVERRRAGKQGRKIKQKTKNKMYF